MIRELFLSDFPLSSCVWQSTIFIMVGLVGSFILRHRSSRAHQVLFLAMMAAVIVPIMSILVKHYELGMFVAEPVAIQSRAEDKGRVGNYGAPGIISAENIEHNPGLIEKDLPSALAGSESAEFSWRSLVLGGWIAASLILFARLLVTFVLGVRLLGRALPLECEKIEEALNLARAKLGIDKDVKVYSSRGVRSPVIWCWRRKPILLVPSAAGRFDNGVDWAGVLCHELAHWKRRDHISGLLAELAVCILPWHPLLWWAKSRLVRLSEQACDDWVVATGQPGTDYAESLLDLTPGGQMAFVPAVVSSKRGLADRVRRILKDKCGNPRTGALWALTVSIVATCLAVGVACAQTRPAKPETATEQKQKPTKSLHKAAIDGDIDQIRLHLSIGTAVNAKNKYGTALHTAARKGHREIARLLISHGADVNAKSEMGWTPLHFAALHGETKTAELLIVKGADVNAKNNEGWTPISFALRSAGGGRQMIELLVSRGAKVSALHLAAHRGNLDKVRNSLKEGTNVDARDEGGRTLLHYAASAGQMDVVEFLIGRVADVDARDNRSESVYHPGSETPLYYAAIAGWRNVAELLIAEGADVNARNSDRYTPLHSAAWKGRGDVAKLLIAKGADVMAKDKWGWVPLHAAVCSGLVEVAELLIAKGNDPDAKDKWGMRPMHLAIKYGQTHMVEVLEVLIAKGADVNAKDKWGLTPLYYAIREKDKEKVKVLIDKGADVNFTANEVSPPLHYAIWNKDVELAKLLVANGADFNLKDSDGWTAFHYAVVGGNRELFDFFISKGAEVSDFHFAAWRGDLTGVKRFLEQGTDVNIKDDQFNWTPLHWATFTAQRDIAEFLIAKGADVNAGGEWDGTPLHNTAVTGQGELAELFLAKGAEVNAKDSSGKTPLHDAARSAHQEVVAVLIANGADVNPKDEKGRTPLLRAAQKGHKTVVELLISHGADVNAKDYDGRTPLSLAKEKAHSEIVELLRKHGAKE